MPSKGKEPGKTTTSWLKRAKNVVLNECGMCDVGRDARLNICYIHNNGIVGALSPTNSSCPMPESTNGALREAGLPHADHPPVAPRQQNNNLSQMQGLESRPQPRDEVPEASLAQKPPGTSTEVISPSPSESGKADAELRASNWITLKTLDCEVTPSDAWTSRAEMYSLLMLMHKAGYPLYRPEPLGGLATAYRKIGVRVGDVGVVTPNGAFDFLFNACRSQDDSLSISRAKLPDGSEILEARISNTEMFGRDEYLTSTHVSQIENSHTVDFQCFSAEGAVLALPEGATVYEARNPDDFQRHAARHAVSWYEYMLNCGMNSPNGSLYLITECVKSRNWGIAAFYGKPMKSDHLRFVPLEKSAEPSHVVQAPYRWDRCGKVESRIGPKSTDIVIADHDEPNQCIFLRGYKIKLRQDIWDKLKDPVGVLSRDGQTSKLGATGTANSSVQSSNSPSRSESASGNRSVSGSSGKEYQRGKSPTEQIQVSEDTSHNANPLVDADSLELRWVTLEENVSIPSPAHPSDLINDMLLQRNPTANVAVTHDREWSDILPFEFFVNSGKPKLDNLLQNIDRSYTSIVDEDGCAILVGLDFTTQNIPSMPIRHTHHEPGSSGYTTVYHTSAGAGSGHRSISQHSSYMLPLPSELPDITHLVVVDYAGRALLWGTSDVFIGNYQGLQVAVKIFGGPGEPPAEIKAGFLREANTWMKSLETPNPYIAELFGVVDCVGPVCRLGLVSRYYEHIDAMEYIKSRRFNEDEKGTIFCKIARGLKHIHNHGVIHGNMKLNNILFDGKGQPKITNFELSRILGHFGYTTTVFMDPSSYLAPEIIQNLRELEEGGPPPLALATKAGDVYALAILAAEIFMERYHGPIRQLAYQQIVRDNIRPLKTSVNSRKYFPLMEHCWQKDKHARPDINQIVLILEDIRGVIHDRKGGLLR